MARITKRLVDSLEPKADEFAVWDDQLLGFGVRVRASGAMSYVVGYRAGSGRAVPKKRLTVGAVGKITPEQARKLAQGILGAVAHGRDPAKERRKAEASGANTLRSVAENYLTRGAHDRDKIKLRTVEAQRATFERLVYPTLGARQIDGIKRSEINTLLDTIEDERGPRMASLTLAYLSRVMNWHASRADDFRSPIVRGMSKDRGAATRRDRVLADDELRAFWRASGAWDHPFARMLRFVLLTATRRDEAAGMQWSELDDATWTIPAVRYKTKIDLELPLSRAARDVLAADTLLAELRKAAAERGDDPEKVTLKEGFVFTTTGEAGIGGFSKFKAQFDALMLDEMRDGAAGRGDDLAKIALERWTIHDLRRTARSMMTQAGVPPDHAERALGHVIGGVRGVYDRHGYFEEKRRAFEALASQIARVLDPQPNVVPMRRAADAAAGREPGHI
jgi:integrase